MPRNAAKRLNNEETRLPTSKTNKVRRNSKTATNQQQQQQQQQHLQQQQQVNAQHQIREIEIETETTITRKAEEFDISRANATLEQERLLIKLIQKQQKAKQQHLEKHQVQEEQQQQHLQPDDELLAEEERPKQQVADEQETAIAIEVVAIETEEIQKPKAPQRPRGRRRNWRKNKIQTKSTKSNGAANNNQSNNNNNNNNSTNNNNSSSSSSSSSCSSNNSAGSSSCSCAGVTQSAVGFRSSQRGRECGACGGENVVKADSHNNNKTAGGGSRNNINLGATSAAGDDDGNNDADDDDNLNLTQKYSPVLVKTTADITIEPTVVGDDEDDQANNEHCDQTTTSSTLSDQQKNCRLSTLRIRRKEDELKISPNTNANTNTTGTDTIKRALAPHLDPAVFNRIDVYEESDDAKSNGSNSNHNKRKRFDNFSTITTRGRRAATQKYYTETGSGESRFLAAATTIASTVTTALGGATATAATTVATAVSATTASAAATLEVLTAAASTTATLSSAAATILSAATPKRRRVMSLYDRRYQTGGSGAGSRSSVSDTELAGRGALITNGYLSTTRGVNAVNALTAGGTIGDGSDATSVDLATTPYFISGAPNSGSSMAHAAVGNGPTMNHAPSMATLCNIGNTCYMNSVVYTLRFAPQFLHNLHHLIVDLAAIQQHLLRQRAKSASLGRGSSNVLLSGNALAENARSWSSKDLLALEQCSSQSHGNAGGNLAQKTRHQLLTEKLHEVYQCLHRNEVVESTEPHHADTLLHAIQDVNATFEGNQQQDAHEFLMCVLNSLRETSQMLIKAIAECPDVISNG